MVWVMRVLRRPGIGPTTSTCGWPAVTGGSSCSSATNGLLAFRSLPHRKQPPVGRHLSDAERRPFSSGAAARLGRSYAAASTRPTPKSWVGQVDGRAPQPLL